MYLAVKCAELKYQFMFNFSASYSSLGLFFSVSWSVFV